MVVNNELPYLRAEIRFQKKLAQFFFPSQKMSILAQKEPCAFYFHMVQFFTLIMQKKVPSPTSE